jgi:hypothetical protein
MADKVKPLKIETGSDTDYLPTETDPNEDYLATKGIAFNNLDTYLLERLGKNITIKVPNFSYKPTYLGNGSVDYVEVFDGFTQTTGNRVAKATIGYNGSGDPITETVLLYDTNGTTVLRTITNTLTYTSFYVTKIEAAFT